MTPAIAQMIMGWPAILASLLASITGIVLKRPALLVTGAILCLGFAWYIRSWPNLIFDVLGYTLPLLHLAGALAVHRQKASIAWLLLIPHAGLAAYLGAVVLTTGR